MNKLFEAKKKFPPINKDGNNPFFNSKYATLNNILDKIEPVLNDFNLHIINRISDNSVITEIIYEDTVLISSAFNLPQINDPQKMGSAITYGRRYNLVCIFNLNIEEDDDGNATKPKAETISKDCKAYMDRINKAKDKTELKAIGAELSKDTKLTVNDKDFLRNIYAEKDSKLK